MRFTSQADNRTPTTTAGGGCVIEFEKASGAKMRVELPGSQLLDLAALNNRQGLSVAAETQASAGSPSNPVACTRQSSGAS